VAPTYTFADVDDDPALGRVPYMGGHRVA
jgi:hypothetical protein